MKKVIDSLYHIGSGAAGAGAITALDDNHDFAGTVCKILITVVSLIPSIRALFKKNKPAVVTAP